MGDTDKDIDETQLAERTPDWKPGEDWKKDPNRPETKGDATKPAQPDGTTPLERDQAPTNQKR